MWNNYSKIVLLIFVIGLFSSSCKTRKSIKKAGGSQNEAALLQADSVIQNLMNNEFIFDNFKAKIRTKYNDNKGEKHTFTTLLKIQKDTAILFKLSAFGIPVATIYLTPDSIKILDRLKKTYSLYSFGYINKVIDSDLSFHDIQNVLVGNSVFLDTTKKHLLHKETMDVFLREVPENSTGNSTDWEVNYWVNKLFKIGKVIVLNKSKKSKLKIENYDFKDVKGQLFPDKITINYISPKDTVNISLNYRKIKTEKNATFTFKVPEKYTKNK